MAIVSVLQNTYTWHITDDALGVVDAPRAPGNRHHQAVLDWIAAGGVPTQAPPPPPPTPAQLRDARYRAETDPILTAIYGYDLELELAPDKAAKDAITAKRAPLVAAWVAAKAQIRKDIP